MPCVDISCAAEGIVSGCVDSEGSACLLRHPIAEFDVTINGLGAASYRLTVTSLASLAELVICHGSDEDLRTPETKSDVTLKSNICLLFLVSLRAHQ